jgi:tetratricopeptide (TPR) repeat protein
MKRINFAQLLLFFTFTCVVSAFGQNGAAACGEKDYDCKIDAYTKAVQANPNDTESYFNRGVAYKNNGQRDMAVADLTKYISMKPSNPTYLADGYFQRAIMYRQMGKFDLAIADYTSALLANPKHQDARLGRGLAYASKKDYLNALKDYNSLIQSDPKYAEAYYDRGLMYMDQDKNDLALADFNKYVSMDLTDNEYWADGYTNRGIVRTRKGDLVGALADLSKAITLKPNDPVAYRARATAYRKQGKTTLANEDDSKAAELDGK